MELVKLQRALALLYVNSESIDELANHPVVFGDKLGLSAQEVARLRSLPLLRLRSYARSLVRKRLSETRHLLPQTASALGSDFEKHFFTYAQTTTLGPHPRYVRDARSFAEFVARNQPQVAGTARAERSHLAREFLSLRL